MCDDWKACIVYDASSDSDSFRSMENQLLQFCLLVSIFLNCQTFFSFFFFRACFKLAESLRKLCAGVKPIACLEVLSLFDILAGIAHCLITLSFPEGAATGSVWSLRKLVILPCGQWCEF